MSKDFQTTENEKISNIETEKSLSKRDISIMEEDGKKKIICKS